MKTCARCNEEKPFEQFHKEKNRPYYRSYCKPCNTARQKEKRETDPEKYQLLERKYKLRSNYGITPEDYDSILALQGGGCGICGSTEPNSSRIRFFTVDHCHVTRAIRGILCTNCNTAIGHFKDNPTLLAAAVAYLQGTHLEALRAS